MNHANSKLSHQRWDAFDHLRGLAAVAVVVLHGAYAYSFQPLVGLIWPVPLDEPNRIADGLFWATEGCVMPLFFLMSGFFLAQSLGRTAPAGVIRGRTRRLIVPLATIGIPILILDLWIWGLGLVAMGQVSMHQYLTLNYPREIRADLFGPAHLWYIEYLWVMCAGVCLAWWTWSRMRRDSENDQPPTVPIRERLSLPWLGLGLLSGLLWLILAFEPAIVVGFQHGWLPAFPKFFHGLLFLLMGMLLNRSPRLLEGLRTLAPLLLAGAAVSFCLMLPRVHAVLRTGDGTAFDAETGAILAAYALLATAGITGGSLRWLNRPRPVLAALGAASFWLYIVHHPILGLAQLGLRPTPLPAGIKFLVATGGTLVICLISYRFLVRDGRLEQLLNGEWPWRSRPVESAVCMPMPVAVEEKYAA